MTTLDRVRIDPDYPGHEGQVVGFPDGHPETADWPLYVRGDLYTAAQAEVARLRDALHKAANRLDWLAGLVHADKARDQGGEWAEEARAALEVKP